MYFVSGHIDEIARILERRNAPPIILISNCEFPTTTQVDGIAANKFIELFCFNENACPYEGNVSLQKDVKKSNTLNQRLKRL